MNLEQLKARLGEIEAKITEFQAMDGLTDEQVSEVEGLGEEFDKIQNQIKAQEKIAAIAAKSTQSARVTASAPAPKVTVGQDRRILDPKAGFSHAGEFYTAVRKASLGKTDDRLLIANAAAKESSGEDGGFLIPTDFRSDIQKKVTGDESLLSRTRQFQTSSNNLHLPTNETAPWDGTGVQAYWEAEAGQFTESKPKFGEMALRLHKLTSLVRVTDELLEDASALDSWIRGEAPAAMLHKVNSAIISGTGAGMPQGILNSTFKYKQAKVGGQAADTVLFANVNAMQGRLLPNSRANAVWIVNPAVLPLLPLMKFDDAATSPVPVYIPATGVSGAPYGTLYGLPILPMMGGSRALGDEGDIILADLSYYYSALKTQGIKSDVSSHVYFLTQEQAFRFSMRIAGQIPYKAPVQTENGAYQMSGFITLEDR